MNVRSRRRPPHPGSPFTFREDCSTMRITAGQAFCVVSANLIDKVEPGTIYSVTWYGVAHPFVGRYENRGMVSNDTPPPRTGQAWVGFEWNRCDDCDLLLKGVKLHLWSTAKNSTSRAQRSLHSSKFRARRRESTKATTFTLSTVPLAPEAHRDTC